MRLEAPGALHAARRPPLRWDGSNVRGMNAYPRIPARERTFGSMLRYNHSDMLRASVSSSGRSAWSESMARRGSAG
jgi:hypothetical protein